MDNLTKELIKFASTNNITESHSLMRTDENNITYLTFVARKNKCINDVLVGAIKGRVNGEVIVKTNNIRLLETEYKGVTLARDFEQVNLSRDIKNYTDITGIDLGMRNMTVMRHPQGYTQNAVCAYFIGRTVNLLEEEGATTGEIIFYLYRLATNNSSKKIVDTEIEVDKIKKALDSTLGPWFTMISLCKSGFVNYGTISGMFINEISIDRISSFDYSDIKCFRDLLSLRENSKYNSVKELKEEHELELYAIIEKLNKLSLKFNKCGYTNLTVMEVVGIIKKIVEGKELKEIKDLASDIRREEKLERDSRGCKGKPIEYKEKWLAKSLEILSGYVKELTPPSAWTSQEGDSNYDKAVSVLVRRYIKGCSEEVLAIPSKTDLLISYVKENVSEENWEKAKGITELQKAVNIAKKFVK